MKGLIPRVKLVLVVRNPIVRLVSDVVHEFLEGELNEEEMPDIDSVLLYRGNNSKILSTTLKHHCIGGLFFLFLYRMDHQTPLSYDKLYQHY